MGKSKSPKKESAPSVEVDPEARQRARAAQQKRAKKRQSVLDKYSYHLVFATFALIMAFGLFHTFWKSGPNIHTTLVNDPDYIAQRNSMGGTFQVGPVSMFNDYKLVDVKSLINNQATNKQQLYKCSTGNKDTIVPETYNFREEKPECARPILTQGNCSSSYATAAVSAIVDRWCKSNSKDFPTLSPQTPIACDKAINNKCVGGYVSRTLDYAKIYGLVQQKCYPFALQVDTPEKCQEKTVKCQKFKIADYCVSSDEENIKQEIFNHGPVISVIPIYRDFLIYKKGLYQVYPKNQKFSSGHAVKLIGWKAMDGKNCWLVENTWGEDWGEQGVACIMTNQEQLQIERFTIAPALNTEDIQSDVQVDADISAEKTEGSENIGENVDEHVQL